MAYKRASTLVGLPDQDRGWEDVQVRCLRREWIALISAADDQFFCLAIGKDILQMVGG
jgi:hypothetical protein